MGPQWQPWEWGPQEVAAADAGSTPAPRLPAKPFDEIQAAGLEALLTNEVSEGKTTGTPEAVLGLAGVNADQEIRHLEETIRTGLEPTIIGIRLRTLGSLPDGPVLLVRIPKSWTAPQW